MMNASITVKDFGREIAFLDSKTGYELIVNRKSPDDAEFHFPSTNSPYYSWTRARTIMKVTARDLEDYRDDEMQDIKPGSTIIELGPGLGEFVPSLVRWNTKNRGRKFDLIVIDIANYNAMAQILIYAMQNKKLDRRAKSRLDELLDRCNILMDSSKVEIHKEDVREVIKKSELQKRADLVVDLYGPVHYLYQASGVSVEDSKRNLTPLLKPRGKLVVYPKGYSGRG
jgi:hypothetical protein